jgi:hypothetical protein
MKKISILLVLLVGCSSFAEGYVTPSEARIAKLLPMGDAKYFVQFAQPVRFESFDAVIPTPPPAETDEKRVFDIQVGLIEVGQVYIRVRAERDRPAGKEWTSLPKDFRDEVAMIEKLLLDTPELKAKQCPDGKTCEKECKKNPDDCCSWYCN